jgi:hypothetical protein
MGDKGQGVGGDGGGGCYKISELKEKCFMKQTDAKIESAAQL